jgi:4-carboxymuconolactone decarboxylase
MTERPKSPRIAPIPPEERSETTKTLLASFGLPEPLPNLFTTLVRAEGLTRRWVPFGGKLLNGKLPHRDRELLILRTGWNCQAEYEWSQHVVISRDLGFTDDEINRVTVGPEAGWDEFEAALLQAADELHVDSCITDETWGVLASRYTDAELIELIMLVGEYHLVAMTVNTLGVALDSEPRLPEAPSRSI